MTYRIRAVDPFDDEDAADEIKHLHAQCMPEDPLPDLHDGFWWLVTVGNGSVGYAGLHPSKRFLGMGYLCAAGVLPVARGNGLQARLIRVRERKAISLGWEWMVTDTVPSNPASSNTLIKCGYRTYWPERQWRGRGAIFWRKRLV